MIRAASILQTTDGGYVLGHKWAAFEDAASQLFWIGLIPVETASLMTVYGGLFITGLLSSLHCIGMCGPILVGFSQAFERVSLTVEGRARGTTAWDLAWYHAGRIWTYAALGFVIGLVGQTLHHGSAWIGWQRAAGISMAVAVIFSGAALMGVIPGLRPDAILKGCPTGRWQTLPWFKTLVQSRGPIARLLLGAVMGLLPCGLVYAMLTIVAGLPSPWHSAAGMIIFGLGTLPSLTAVFWLGRLIPRRLRAHGTTLAAVVVILTGAWMLARTLVPHGAHTHHHNTSMNSQGSD